MAAKRTTELRERETGIGGTEEGIDDQKRMDERRKLKEDLQAGLFRVAFQTNGDGKTGFQAGDTMTFWRDPDASMASSETAGNKDDMTEENHTDNEGTSEVTIRVKPPPHLFDALQWNASRTHSHTAQASQASSTSNSPGPESQGRPGPASDTSFPIPLGVLKVGSHGPWNDAGMILRAGKDKPLKVAVSKNKMAMAELFGSEMKTDESQILAAALDAHMVTSTISHPPSPLTPPISQAKITADPITQQARSSDLALSHLSPPPSAPPNTAPPKPKSAPLSKAQRAQARVRSKVKKAPPPLVTPRESHPAPEETHHTHDHHEGRPCSGKCPDCHQCGNVCKCGVQEVPAFIHHHLAGKACDRGCQAGFFLETAAQRKTRKKGSMIAMYMNLDKGNYSVRYESGYDPKQNLAGIIDSILSKLSTNRQGEFQGELHCVRAFVLDYNFFPLNCPRRIYGDLDPEFGTSADFEQFAAHLDGRHACGQTIASESPDDDVGLVYDTCTIGGAGCDWEGSCFCERDIKTGNVDAGGDHLVHESSQARKVPPVGALPLWSVFQRPNTSSGDFTFQKDISSDNMDGSLLMQIQETYDRVRILADRKWEKQNRRPPGYASNARRHASAHRCRAYGEILEKGGLHMKHSKLEQSMQDALADEDDPKLDMIATMRATMEATRYIVFMDDEEDEAKEWPHEEATGRSSLGQAEMRDSIVHFLRGALLALQFCLPNRLARIRILLGYAHEAIRRMILPGMEHVPVGCLIAELFGMDDGLIEQLEHDDVIQYGLFRDYVDEQEMFVFGNFLSWIKGEIAISFPKGHSMVPSNRERGSTFRAVRADWLASIMIEHQDLEKITVGKKRKPQHDNPFTSPLVSEGKQEVSKMTTSEVSLGLTPKLSMNKKKKKSISKIDIAGDNNATPTGITDIRKSVSSSGTLKNRASKSLEEPRHPTPTSMDGKEEENSQREENSSQRAMSDLSIWVEPKDGKQSQFTDNQPSEVADPASLSVVEESKVPKAGGKARKAERRLNRREERAALAAFYELRNIQVIGDSPGPWSGQQSTATVMQNSELQGAHQLEDNSGACEGLAEDAITTGLEIGVAKTSLLTHTLNMSSGQIDEGDGSLNTPHDETALLPTRIVDMQNISVMVSTSASAANVLETPPPETYVNLSVQVPRSPPPRLRGRSHSFSHLPRDTKPLKDVVFDIHPELALAVYEEHYMTFFQPSSEQPECAHPSDRKIEDFWNEPPASIEWYEEDVVDDARGDGVTHTDIERLNTGIPSLEHPTGNMDPRCGVPAHALQYLEDHPSANRGSQYPVNEAQAEDSRVITLADLHRLILKTRKSKKSEEMTGLVHADPVIPSEPHSHAHNTAPGLVFGPEATPPLHELTATAQPTGPSKRAYESLPPNTPIEHRSQAAHLQKRIGSVSRPNILKQQSWRRPNGEKVDLAPSMPHHPPRIPPQIQILKRPDPAKHSLSPPPGLNQSVRYPIAGQVQASSAHSPGKPSHPPHFVYRRGTSTDDQVSASNSKQPESDSRGFLNLADTRGPAIGLGRERDHMTVGRGESTYYKHGMPGSNN